MHYSEDQANRSALLAELSRMKKLGFLVVEEAFDVAQVLDLDACGNMPLTAVAFIASERGYAQFKSRLKRDAALRVHSDADPGENPREACCSQ